MLKFTIKAIKLPGKNGPSSSQDLNLDGDGI